MNPYRILLADDHRIIRQGIRRIIEEKPGMQVVGGVDNGLEALKAVKALQPDMVILDLAMPQLSGIAATRQIKAKDPAIKVLILTMYKEEHYLARALSAGADGYLIKEDADIELLNAIEVVRHGQSFISPLLSGTLADHSAAMNQGRHRKPDHKALTPRQIEILRLISRGKSSKEIADLLLISTRTVENHRANIMDRLEMRKNIDLVRYAIRSGYLPADEL